MPKQPALPRLSHTMKKKVTRREAFLAEMDAVVPWTRLLALIEPHYPKAGPKGGRPPMPLETMLRVYFLQNWYALSDPMAEESLYDSEAMRHFAGIEPGDDRIPDGPRDRGRSAAASARRTRSSTSATCWSDMG
jgi:IS5 family transposase